MDKELRKNISSILAIYGMKIMGGDLGMIIHMVTQANKLAVIESVEEALSYAPEEQNEAITAITHALDSQPETDK